MGLTHVQHQLLVAVKGHRGDAPPTVTDLAGYLLLRHHSTVELIDRAEAAGFVRRVADASDARVVRVELTPAGDRLVTELAQSHLAELHDLAAAMNDLVAAERSPAARARSAARDLRAGDARERGGNGARDRGR